MWECIEKMQLTYEYEDSKVHVDANYEWRPEEQAQRETAVRKLKETLFGHKFLKDQVYASFATGLVMLYADTPLTQRQRLPHGTA